MDLRTSYLIYQSYAEQGEPPPPPAAPELSWHPTYPDRCPSLVLSAAILAGAFFFILPEVSHPQRSAVQGAVQVRAGVQVQYQAQVAPFYSALTPPVVTPDIDSWGQPPSQPIWPPDRRASLGAGAVEPRYLPIADLRWEPEYPDWIDRRGVRAADQRADFTPTYLPIHDLRWQGTFPDRLFVRFVAPEPFYHAEPFPRPAAVTTVEWLPAYPDFLRRPWAPEGGETEPRYLPITDLRWQGDYPAWIARQAVRAADQQAVFAPRYLPIADLRWAPTFPDWHARRLMLAAHQRAVADVRYYPVDDLRWLGSFTERVVRLVAAPWLGSSAFWPYPIANPEAPTLSWHPDYPGLIWVGRLPIAAYPFGGRQNLDPIPNEAVGGSQVITLGVEIGVTDFPVLGGWVPF